MNLREWNKMNAALRSKITKIENGTRKYLLARLAGTEQAKDIMERTPLIGDFCRVKINIKAFSDEERAKKGLPPLNFSDNEAVFRAIRGEFDMPLWAFYATGVPLQKLAETFIYQTKACNIHCPWCYVDDVSKNGREDGGGWFSMAEIMDVFEAAQKKRGVYNFRPSGGEPSLAPEQWLECLEEIQRRGLTAYVQGDTNLTTGHFIKTLPERALYRVGAYDNFGLLCSFKGTDTESFLRAIGMGPQFSFLEEERWFTFACYIAAGVDAYPFVYDPNPETLPAFLEKGMRLFGDGFGLKTWVFSLKLYGPEQVRLRAKDIDPAQYQRELDEKFRQSEEVMQEFVWKRFGVNYKAIPRPGIRLRIRR